MPPHRFDIARYLHVRSAAGPGFAPDGRFVSFLSNVTGITQLWQVPVEGGWPTQLTFTGDSVRGAWYNPRRPELVFSMDRGGNEQTQLYGLRGFAGNTDHGLGDGWDYTDLTRQPKAVHQFGGWSHDGEAFAFSANRADPSRFDVYVTKGGKGDARLLQEGPGGYYQAEAWSPDDRHLLVRRVESNFNQDLYLLDVAGGRARRLTPHQGEAIYLSPAWSADGRFVYCASTEGGRDRAGLARIDVAAGKLSFIETPDHEVESVRASPGGRWLAWVTNVGGQSGLFVRDLRASRILPRPELPLGVVRDLVFARDDSRLAFVFDGPRHNPDAWLWDLTGPRGAAAPPYQLTHSSMAGIPPEQLVTPVLVHYKTFDGRMIPAWFYPVPAEGGRLPPVIVYPHGGPESQTRPTFNPIFQFFLQHGYAILAPNVRGSSG
ncbi:MAG TPA: hypothetical protein VJ739_15930 [Gemmataceae bacterium]|nr:hypothetical protein [Gemmataceae bacterium]